MCHSCTVLLRKQVLLLAEDQGFLKSQRLKVTWLTNTSEYSLADTKDFSNDVTWWMELHDGVPQLPAGPPRSHVILQVWAREQSKEDTREKP